MMNGRYTVNEEEQSKILSTYFKKGLDGQIDTFPSKEKRKLIILEHTLKRLDSNRIYSEKELNEILKTVYTDYVTIRRSLIEYKFMERSKDCSQYWISPAK